MKSSKTIYILLGIAGGTAIAYYISRLFRKPVPVLKIGLVTDVHWADQPTAQSRYYRDADEKLLSFINEMNEFLPDFIIECGDFIDSLWDETEWDYIVKVFNSFEGEKYHVMGNHGGFNRPEWLKKTGYAASYYSFDKNGFHFIVLDAHYNELGTGYPDSLDKSYIPPFELSWLEEDLKKTSFPTIVFIHHRLDGTGIHFVKNASSVREIFENSGKVAAVFQGHNHLSDERTINNIKYYTIEAMVDGAFPTNSFAEILLYRDGTVAVKRKIY